MPMFTPPHIPVVKSVEGSGSGEKTRTTSFPGHAKELVPSGNSTRSLASARLSFWRAQVSAIYRMSCIQTGMAKRQASTAFAFLPIDHTLPKLREAALGCKGCDLWKSG